MRKTIYILLLVLAIVLVIMGISMLVKKGLSGTPPAMKVVTPEAVSEKKLLPKVITLYQKGEGESDLAAFVSKELSSKQKGIAVFRTVNVLDEPQMAGYFGVSSAPTIVFIMPSGKIYKKYEGYLDKGRILQIIRSMQKS